MTITTSITIGSRQLARDAAELGPLRDSDPHGEGLEALRSRSEEDGYLLLRGLLPREEVLAARERVLAWQAETGAATMGNPAITHDPLVLRVVAAPEIRNFFAAFFGEPVITTDYKWLRTMGRGGCTNAHFDWVYMGRGSQRLTTTWLPIGDVPAEHGGLTILEHSHNSPRFARMRETYGRSDVDREGIQGWFSDDPLELARMAGSRWLVADYRAGDVLCFGLHTMHMSCTQTRDDLRVTCDVRWQPAGDPVDERWFGERPPGHQAWHRQQKESIAKSRARWGV